MRPSARSTRNRRSKMVESPDVEATHLVVWLVVFTLLAAVEL